MKDELEQLLSSLHLRKVQELFDTEVKRAEKEKLSYQCCRARWLMEARAIANRLNAG